jgi:hypothetical protein
MGWIERARVGRRRQIALLKGEFAVSHEYALPDLPEGCLAATVAALVVDQFDATERKQALTRLKVSDPDSLSSAVEAALLEIVDAAKSARVKKLADVGGKAQNLGKRGFALAVLLFA